MKPKIKVSFQGEYGAFSEQAAISYFKGNCIVRPREDFRDVFDDVTNGTSRYGIVPIENSLFGSVSQNYDLLLEYPLSIIGELKLRIKMNLMALPGTSIKDIRHVYSHPQGLGQSDKYLQTLKNISTHPFYDTAGAAKMIAEKRKTDSAAIASTQAALHYGLTILKKGIETDRQNFTRFLLLSKKQRRVQSGKTSVIFAAKNYPGSLYHCLAVFAARKINLLRIESRPFIGKPWNYLFYVDIGITQQETEFKRAMKELRELTTFLKILGSYETGKVVH
ncbi:MAG: prephenate dehydratase [Bacteroidota bacterium]|jgi:prephenate dehydratase